MNIYFLVDNGFMDKKEIFKAILETTKVVAQPIAVEKIYKKMFGHHFYSAKYLSFSNSDFPGLKYENEVALGERVVVVEIDVAVGDAGIESEVVVDASCIPHGDVREGDVWSEADGEGRLAGAAETPACPVLYAVCGLVCSHFFLRH